MAGFYENITVSAAVPNAAADAEAAKDAAVTAKNEAEAAKDAAEVAKNLAEQHKDTASGYVGTVSGAQSIADANVASTAGDRQAAEDARDLAYSYGQAASLSAQSAEISANSVSANAATVAGMADNVDIVAGLQNTLVTLAHDLGIGGNITTVRPYVNQIDTVAGMVSNVATVAADAADIGTVATDLTGSNNIGTVAGLAPKINTVAGLSSELTSVHGNNADITTVATSLNAGNIIANVSSSIGNVNNVGNKLAEIEAVKNALSDIAAVENKLTEIDSVSDSITNVDSVAGVISEVQTVAGVSDEVANLSKSTGNMATLVSKLGQTTDLAGAVIDAQNSATSAASSASTASTHATTASGHASTAATHAANLGSVAYQDLTAIAESKAVTATDVFVYDTSKDSDGGAWRNRTQGTSWYNEPLNTSSRGATKKFPAVAVIVTESNKVTIYDADDPSMPMWFTSRNTTTDVGKGVLRQLNSYNPTCVSAKDGKVFVGINISGNYASNEGLHYLDFVKDEAGKHVTSSGNTGKVTPLTAYPNTNVTADSSMGVLNSADVNDIAVTVLPNAPIDPDTGLPVLTIAVATDGGVSVIKDDGSVVDLTYSFVSGECDHVYFLENGGIGYSLRSGRVYQVVYDSIPDADTTAKPDRYYTSSTAGAFTSSILPTLRAPTPDTGNGGACFYGNNIAVGRPSGLSVFHDSPLEANRSQCFITKDYNTGWMNGDIKLATLMDTTAETISAPELVTNGDFSSFGSELVDNGDFSTTSDWTFPNGDGSISNGQATVTATTDSNKYIRQDLGNSLVSGRTYAVSFNVVAETGTGLAYVRLGGVDVAPVGSYPQGVETHYITYTGGSPELRFMTYANSGAGFTLDDVSVKEVTGWSGLTNASISINAGKLRLTSNGATDGYVASDYFPTTAGKTYRLSLDFVNETGSYEKVYVQNANGGIIADSVDGLGTDQTVTLTFVATTSTSRVRLKTYNGTSGWDNFSCVQVEPDRSVNNNGLNIVGNVTKSAVATGAELVAYSGFSNSGNYIKQPYNSDLTFGTGDFTIMFWGKDSATASDHMIERANSARSLVSFYVTGSGSEYRLNVPSDLGTSYVSAGGARGSDIWEQLVFTRKDGVLYAYRNGELQNTDEHPHPLNTDGTEELYVGIAANVSSSSGGLDLALLRISATAPTAEQIAKIYRDEKPLFQEGAKCTLSGKDDVQAIAYDEDTGKLHVGNGDATSGRYRDEFVGLQNVNPVFRDTYSIGTAISAVNGLVVEE